MAPLPASLASSPGTQWLYVDATRTHLVHAQVEPRNGGHVFLVTEAPFGSRSGDDAVVQEVALSGPWDVPVERAALEMRLAGSGDYERAEPPFTSWTKLSARRANLPLEGHLVPLPGASAEACAEFHLFHDRKAMRERALVSLPRLDLPETGRFVLADLAFRFPHVERGELSILHARLADVTLRSRLVRAHLDLRGEGYAKLVTNDDFDAAYGPDWREEVRSACDALARRLLAGRTGKGDGVRERAPAPEPVDARLLHLAFRDPQLARVRARHASAAIEADLVMRGEFPIRRFVATRRRTAPHNEQHHLSLLEAYLLAKHADAVGYVSLRDEEGAKLLRLLATVSPATAPR